jgi:hypothetical protein
MGVQTGQGWFDLDSNPDGVSYFETAETVSMAQFWRENTRPAS